jgi:hypothetical protein
LFLRSFSFWQASPGQGASTFIMLAPALRAGVVVLINMDEVDASALATDLMKLLVAADPKSK